MPLILFLVFLSFGRLLSAAEVEVGDPRHILESLYFESGRKDFSQAFTCMKSVSFFMRSGICKVSCEFSICEENCAHTTIQPGIAQIEECDQDPVHIYTNLGTDIPITKADYNGSSKTVVKSILRSITQFYDRFEYFEVTMANFPMARILIENGQLIRLNTAIIIGDAFPNRLSPDKMRFQIEIDPTKNGLEQLMCVSVGEGCSMSSHSDYLFKRKGLKHGYQ